MRIATGEGIVMECSGDDYYEELDDFYSEVDNDDYQRFIDSHLFDNKEK